MNNILMYLACNLLQNVFHLLVHSAYVMKHTENGLVEVELETPQDLESMGKTRVIMQLWMEQMAIAHCS